jgi:hypothetical protein
LFLVSIKRIEYVIRNYNDLEIILIETIKRDFIANSIGLNKTNIYISASFSITGIHGRLNFVIVLVCTEYNKITY